MGWVLETLQKSVRGFVRARVRGCSRGSSPIYAALAAALILIMSVLSQACGLEYVLALTPPEYIETSIADKYFRIGLTSDNDEPEFRGVELYYKFYGKNETNLVTNLSSFDELVSGGFYRLASDSDEAGKISKPLIAVPVENRGHDTHITLDLSSTANAHIYATPQEANGYSLSSLEVRRGVTKSNGEYKPFSEFAASDPDVNSISQDFQVEPEVILLVYAISFGKKDIATDAHSKAVCLFNIRINVTIVP